MTILLARAPVSGAEEMVGHAESLAAIPADASFYAAWLKNAAQIEALQETGAWRKLMTIPAFQMGLMQAQTWWQFPPVENMVAVKNWIEGPEGQKMLALLAEMGSDEIFVYGDQSFTELIEIAMKINSQITRDSYHRLEQAGDVDALENEELVKHEMDHKLAQLLRKHKNSIRVPSLVKGFRIQDTELASELLDLLETKLKLFFVDANLPLPWQDKLQRSTINEHDLLTFTVSGDMLPWDEIESEMPNSPELYELLKGMLSDKRAVLAVGVVNQFVVISLGDSIDHFQGLGEGQLLADTPAFQRLNHHADQRVVTLGYVSGEFLQAASSNEQSFTDLAVTAKGFLSLADLEDDRRIAIENDIDELARDIIAYLPEPGALAMTTFWTDRGYESFSYNWGEMAPNLDATRPLTLIHHLGDDSIGWFVGRGKQSVEEYDHFVSWLKRGFDHFEAIVEPESAVEDWAEYEAARDQVLPLLGRLDTANRELLIPGMADGQGAIVFEATATDNQWCDFMPAAQEEFPLPTLSLVYGVSEVELVKRGAAEYFDVIQDVVDIAHEAEPGEIPQFTISTPTETAITGGTIYSYDLPADWGVNDRIAPNAALSESVLVLSWLPELSEKLLSGVSLTIDGPAAEFNRPLAYAAHFQCAKFIDLLKPWIDYGIQLAIENADENAAAAVGMVGFVKPQVYQFLDVLKVFDSYTGVTYHENDTWVTHGELRLIDLEY
jgi:hypothetical protein